MQPFMFQRIMAVMLLISGLAFNGVSSSRHKAPAVNREHTGEDCPPCEFLFSKLEKTGRSGKLAQDVKVQERGEPKSGTGVTYFRATAALMRACDYLQGLFDVYRENHLYLTWATSDEDYYCPSHCPHGGTEFPLFGCEGSCRVDFNEEEKVDDGLFSRFSNKSMIFDPSLGSGDAKCSCDTVDRVLITTSEANKHRLPVNVGCAFSHVNGIPIAKDDISGNATSQPCAFADGTPVNNHDDLWRCMYEANCDIIDDWIQMAVFRDPRPTIVSMFYHLNFRTTEGRDKLNAFVVRGLPILCQWLAVRYILFTGILPDRSIEFWYADTIGDPLGWHYHWLYSVGLQLPFHVVEAMARAAVADNLGFKHKKFDRHRGEKSKKGPGLRQFEDEVGPEICAFADDVLRAWLPPALLERFGVVP